ncbi:MAG TPA: glycosyltransferase family 2 protein [Myxococcota bacterium]|nr:glycosyltransferase family 2 protein [Myxococcota bacterium]HRY92814.1 glycosyltransferase family 2 protein [Myxococcota bacterium]HSA19810.1 glycosyltransferase family 2 protein [Myxococcota bacterium]
MAAAAPRFAFVIPVFDHPRSLPGVVAGARAYGLPVFVVDDGSGAESRAVVDSLAGVTVLRHARNLGKGAALRTGLAAAVGVADYAVCLDADGQHDPADAAGLMRAAAAGPRRILVGRRRGMTGESVPWTSRFGRKFSNFWVWASGGPPLADTQSGYRLYPLPEVLRLGSRARRFQWEVEIVVLARWKGLPVEEHEVGVVYSPPGGRVSHFRPWTDFWRNAGTFMRLIFTRLFVPRARRARWLPAPPPAARPAGDG